MISSIATSSLFYHRVLTIFSSSSQWVPNLFCKFPMSSLLVPQVPNASPTFPNLFCKFPMGSLLVPQVPNASRPPHFPNSTSFCHGKSLFALKNSVLGVCQVAKRVCDDIRSFQNWLPVFKSSLEEEALKIWGANFTDDSHKENHPLLETADQIQF